MEKYCSGQRHQVDSVSAKLHSYQGWRAEYYADEFDRSEECQKDDSVFQSFIRFLVPVYVVLLS